MLFLVKQCSSKKLVILVLVNIFLFVNCLNMIIVINSNNNSNSLVLKNCDSFESGYKQKQTEDTKKTKTISSRLEFPSFFELLPHLNGLSEESLVPDLLNKQSNKLATIVIGISTIKRQNTSYLLTMLDSLLKSLNNKEKDQILIVLLVAELNDKNFKLNLINELLSKYSDELNNNLIEIISPSKKFYPDFKKLNKDETFKDSPERIQWRTKQNYDISYLMNYCRSRGKYYLQLEDDVISRRGFVTEILNHIESLKENNWVMIEYSPLGFIGKLFKTSDLPYFIHIFLIYSEYKPVDMLHNVVLTTMVCDPSKDFRNCEDNLKRVKLKYSTSLFQHIGVESSLKGKTQTLKDPSFQEKRAYESHTNPEAVITTSLKVYSIYSIQDCYSKKNFFWSFSPKLNDTINFKFQKPFLLKKIYIKSSNSEHPGDVIPVNSTLEIKLTDKKQHDIKYKQTNDSFYIIDYFGPTGVLAKDIDHNLFGQIDEIRIRIFNEAKNWILIYEIAFFS